jgi:hypothetical protein
MLPERKISQTFKRETKMIETILFILSFTTVILYMIKMISGLFGKDTAIPAPILHMWGITFANTYITTPSIMYQVYFWADYFELIKSI